MNAEIMRIDPAMLAQLEHFTLTPVGLLLNGKPTYEEWERFGEMLRLFENGVQWMIGDWLNIGELEFHELASQVIDHEKWAPETVRVYRWVAKEVPQENRRAELTFSHHQEVAGMGKDRQREWLDKAVKGDDGVPWSTGRFKHEVKAAVKETHVEYLATVGFETPAARDILADEYERVGRPVRRHERTKKAEREEI